MQTQGAEALNAVNIVLNPLLLEGFTDEPARKHKKKRIQKKWLKRYGYKPIISNHVYFCDDGRTIMMHPAVFRRFIKELGSEEAAVQAISKYYQKNKPDGGQEDE